MNFARLASQLKNSKCSSMFTSRSVLSRKHAVSFCRPSYYIMCCDHELKQILCDLQQYFSIKLFLVYHFLIRRCLELRNYVFSFQCYSMVNGSFPIMRATHISCLCWQPLEIQFQKHQNHLKTSIQKSQKLCVV